MQCIGIDLHTNRFTCCYRDEGPTEKRIETFEPDEAGLAAFYRTLTAETYVPVEAAITSFCFVRLLKDRVKEAIIANTCEFKQISLARNNTDKIDAGLAVPTVEDAGIVRGTGGKSCNPAAEGNPGSAGAVFDLDLTPSDRQKNKHGLQRRRSRRWAKRAQNGVITHYRPQELYCWQRSAGTGPHGNAQVDFVIQKGSSIIPIEVKSGATGTMQSLRLFMKEKHLPRGARTSLENFKQYEDIEVYPLYAIGNLARN
ncbi:MAG: hypothetical protein LBK74_11225 [Treponema sp.]|jgi:hypothetical protein|nr:hypothetical protein [Treponema sp.]